MEIKSGYDIAKAAGLDYNEGVVLAVFPEKVDDVFMGPPFAWEPGVQAFRVVGRLGSWGRRLLDILTEPSVRVKWWKVRDYARDYGMDLVPTRWSGAIVDIPSEYFDGNKVLGVRLFNEGPWFWPLEAKPKVETQEGTTLEKNLEILKGFGS